MTAREWQPGDVAMVTFPASGTVRRSVRRGGVWVFLDSEGYGIDAHTNDARPLVVIDPEDREQVERLTDWMREHGWTGLDDEAPDDMAATLREFANPTPPRISEPGLWGVVEATVEGIPRRRWVHHEEDRWVCDTGERRYWDDLTDPELVRDGVES